MSDTLAPSVDNYIRGGATILFQRDGTTGYVDLGNIPDFSMASNQQILEHKTSRSGILITDRKESIEAGMGFKIGKDEFNAANLSLVLRAVAAAAFSQASGTTGALALANPVLGNKYKLGAYRVTSVVAKVSGSTKTAGTDYSLEADTGMIRILPGGSILTTDTVNITFTQPAIAGNSVSPLSNTGLVQGALLIQLRTSDGRLWIFEHTKATLSYDGDINLSGNEYAKASGEVTVEPDYTQTDVFGKWTLLPKAA